MKRIDGDQPQITDRNERTETHGAPAGAARGRRGKIAYTRADMPREMIERIANNRMEEAGHEHLDALMDD